MISKRVFAAMGAGAAIVAIFLVLFASYNTKRLVQQVMKVQQAMQGERAAEVAGDMGSGDLLEAQAAGDSTMTGSVR